VTPTGAVRNRGVADRARYDVAAVRDEGRRRVIVVFGASFVASFELQCSNLSNLYLFLGMYRRAVNFFCNDLKPVPRKRNASQAAV
jgi:hypothetical protein